MKRVLFLVWILVGSLLADEVYATFDVLPLKSANLAFSTTGEVDKVLVDVGSRVRKGEVVASLKNDDLKALLDMAKSGFEFAKKEYDRQLKVKKLIDKSRLDKYKFNLDSAKAKYLYQKALYEKTFLKAPFDGVITAKFIESGDVVSGAMIKTALKMQNDDKQKLVLNYDQKYISKVKVGDIFRYKIDGQNSFKEAKITKIYPTVDPKSRMAKAEVIVKDEVTGLFGDGVIKCTK